MMAIPITATGIGSLFGGEFFTYVLPWLFIFAIVYGILSHMGGGRPKSKPSRAIIGLVFAFIVTPYLAPWIGNVMEMTGIFVMVLSVFLVFVIFLELLGVRATKELPKYDKDGKQIGTEKISVSIFEKYGVAFAILFIIIAALVFIAAGGLEAVGITVPGIVVYNYPLIFFIIVIILLIWWMASES